MENILEPGLWQCPSCGGSNSTQNSFCVKCGFNPRNPASPRRSGLVWKIIFALLVLTLVGAGAFFGYRQYQKLQAEKVAREYVQTQQRLFSDSVAAINSISSETNLDEKYMKEENHSLVEEKMRDEKVKAETAADAIDKIIKSADQVKPNDLVAGLDALVDAYWKDAYKATGKYQNFMRFKYSEAKANVEAEALTKAFQDKFKGVPSSFAELKGMVVAEKEMFIKVLALMDGLTLPEGLDGYKKPNEELRKLIQKIDEMIAAIDKRDLNQMLKVEDEMSTLFERMDEAVDDANELSNNYFSQMHDEFVSLRGKADKIKGEFLVLGGQLKVERLDYSIEGW